MKKKMLLLLWVATVSLAVTTFLFWHFEHGQNPKVHYALDVIYWWVVTSATVGYGDIVPVTWQGQLVAMVAIITGFFVFANAVAMVAETVHGYLDRRAMGKAQVEARNHIVICEYTAVADELVQSLPLCPELKDKEVVIISDLVQQNPYPQYHYVSGVPINPATLKMGNTQYADYVFVFANLRFGDPDVKTLHIASRVRHLNPRATIFVEMVDPQHKLMEHAAVKGLIAMDSHEMMEYVLRDQTIDIGILLEKARKTCGK
jgi:voltage-gated potassium channel